MNLSQSKAVIEVIRAESLDQLWHEAEQLGTVKVDSGWRKDDGYTVTIRFERKSGTTINAVGKNTKIAFALAAAINEAREMGAGILA